ncbi:MAG TPA: permease-like cell division protein FtsX [Burkholderiaceae bacterium]|jgi:cell division transport system permease protein
MKTWLRQHRFALAEAFRHLGKRRSGFILNMLVIAIALALPFAGLTLLDNVRPIAQHLTIEPEISVFMAVDTPRDKSVALSSSISRILEETKCVAKLEFIPKEKALSELKGKTGLSEALTTLDGNPLPDGYIIKLAQFKNATEATRVDTLAARLKKLPDVEYVQVDSSWVMRLAALLHVLRLVLLILACTLGMVVVAVVFNTIRLQVVNQREEIEISKLVGATDAFVYRPFYYTGALLGLCAGALALATVALSLQALNDTIAELARLYATEFKLYPLGFISSLLLLLVSAAIGLLGAVLSVRRYLAKL